MSFASHAHPWSPGGPGLSEDMVHEQLRTFKQYFQLGLQFLEGFAIMKNLEVAIPGYPLKNYNGNLFEWKHWDAKGLPVGMWGSGI